MDEYALTAAQFAGLAAGYGDPDAIGVLVDGQVARGRLMVVAAVERLARAGGRPAETAAAAVALIARVERADPGAGREIFRHPFLPAWFNRLADGADPGGSACYLAALAAS
ncbi:MAG TPA: hypothetical protein VFT95_07450, partial [Micromonosporaceae bacterium]|nr:hypothetical protein [Micromonosporaceae bacterium]